MKKFLLSLSMCLLAIAANAQTAGENPAINIEEEVFYFWEDGMESANSVKFADGATTTITGNSEKTVSSGSDITVGDKAYKSMKVSNGSENTFVAPAGKTPVQVTFYSYINKAAGDTDRTTFWAEVDGQTFTAETGTVHKSFKDGANPDIVTFNLAGNSSFTYTNKGDQVCYVMKVAYGTISGGSTETQTPLITLTVEAEAIGKARTFEFGSGVADNKISIDWGDGNIVDGATIAGVYDGWTTTPVTGKPVGSGEIKIYATGAVTYFDCVSKVDGPGITKLDVSNAAELTELYANGNKLTTFDGSKLAKLTRLELHNNSLTEVNLPSSLTTLKLDNNQLTSFDGSNCTLVTTLYLSNNNLGTLDVSMMPALKSLYALNCGLTSVNAPLKVAKAYISVNNNKLETLDVTEATGLENGSLFAMGNNLTEVKLPNVKVKSVNISNNKFTLATIPATANVTTLTYAPQQEMEIADIDGTIDLSAQNNLTGFATEAKPTVYTWITEANDTLVAGTDYTEDAGKFTFVKEQAQKVYCTMTTEALPKFTGTNIFKTIAVTVKAAGGSTEPQTPIITLTVEAESIGKERTFEFGSGVADNKISIDWGDGTIVDGATIAGVYDGWTTTPVTGKPVGSGEIKIYATGAVTYFDCVSKVDGPGITKLDVSNAAELTELYANGNKLTTFDGSKLAKLTRLELHNNSLTEVNLPSSLTTLKLDNNQLTSFDGSNCTLVTTLYLSNNNLGTLDVSMMPALKSLYALNCGLTSVNAPLKVAKAYISVNNNKLETLDVTEATGLENGSLFAMGNNLTEVKLPNVKVKSVNISNNKFTLATIPATANVTTLTYAPQQEMEIADIDGTIDLSAQNNLTGFATEAKPTVYAWYAEDGTALVAGTDYTEEAGKFTFVKEQAQKVYCTMTTEALPKFTGTNIFKTIAVTVKATATGIENIESDAAMTGDIYSVDGKLIKRGANLTDMQKGLYIIKTAAGKTVKVSK